MATTPNYSWVMPDSTDLVKDLPADFATFGNAVDSTVYSNASAAIAKTIVDAKGDLIAATAADTVSRLAVGTNGQVLTADSTASTGVVWATPSSGGMTLISTTTLSGGSISLTSIPQTYKELLIYVDNFKPATDNASLKMRFNSDSTANRHAAFGGSGVVAGSFDSTSAFVSDGNDNSVASGLIWIAIPDYTNSGTWKFGKTWSLTVNSSSTNTYNYTEYFSGYNQVNAVTSLDFLPSTGNFTSGTLYLYGVK